MHGPPASRYVELDFDIEFDEHGFAVLHGRRECVLRDSGQRLFIKARAGGARDGKVDNLSIWSDPEIDEDFSGIFERTRHFAELRLVSVDQFGRRDSVVQSYARSE